MFYSSVSLFLPLSLLSPSLCPPTGRKNERSVEMIHPMHSFGLTRACARAHVGPCSSTLECLFLSFASFCTHRDWRVSVTVGVLTSAPPSVQPIRSLQLRCCVQKEERNEGRGIKDNGKSRDGSWKPTLTETRFEIKKKRSRTINHWDPPPLQELTHRRHHPVAAQQSGSPRYQIWVSGIQWRLNLG